MSSKIPGSIKASNRAQALALGGAAVIGMFYFQFRGHQEHQAAKEASQDPAKVPTWEYRINQTPTTAADHPATLRSNNWEPKESTRK